jgi:hypothetical protein
MKLFPISAGNRVSFLVSAQICEGAGSFFICDKGLKKLASTERRHNPAANSNNYFTYDETIDGSGIERIGSGAQ